MTVTGELYEAVVKIVDERVQEIKVTREMYDRLVDATADLAEAQKRTEERVGELAEAQKATEERLGRVESAVERLAEAQKAAEERLGRVESAVERLAEAQKRTEDAVAALASGVGRLSDTIGHDLESIALVSVPDWLELHLGVKVPSLERRVFTVDGEELEVDFYGEGRKRGVQVSVVGEARSNIHGRDVAAFSEASGRLEKHLSSRVIKVMFGYWIHPSAEAEAKKMGIHVIAPPVHYPRPKPAGRRAS